MLAPTIKDDYAHLEVRNEPIVTNQAMLPLKRLYKHREMNLTDQQMH